MIEKGVLASPTPLAAIPTRWSSSIQAAADGSMYVVDAIRCEKCGHIELNATEKF